MSTIEDSVRRQLLRLTANEEKQQVFSHSTRGNPACIRTLTEDTHITVGNAGDNPLVLQLLVQAYQAQLADDFQSRIDEPLYQPGDRLLLRRADKLVGHVQVSKLIGWYFEQRCPVARLQDFVTLPEYRSSNFDGQLLEVAESVALNEGAALGFVHTDRPEWFEQQDWSRCRGQGHTRANTRAILSHLNANQSKRHHHFPGIEVRTWRHYELDAISSVYQQLSTNTWGGLHRSLETWQWLVGRKAHDQILIAVEKEHAKDDSRRLDTNADPETQSNELSLSDNLAEDLNVVGYAVVRDSNIVEMLTLPGYRSVRAMLVARACQEAIERDHHFVSLHSPATDPMHELLVTAGGSWITDSSTASGQWMHKVLAPDRWVERLYPLLHERAREAGIQRPLEVDFSVGEQLFRFTLTRRSSRFESINRSRAAVLCNWQALQDLLTCNMTFPEAIAQGRLRTPHLSLLRILAALFPPKLFWHSPFPQLRL